MKKNLVFRLLQLGSEWTPGARQRNIFNVPCWGLMIAFCSKQRTDDLLRAVCIFQFYQVTD